jgi:hypothetical protein
MIIDECLSNKEISDRTGAPLRTVERWISEYYREKNKQLADATTDEHVLTTINRSRDRIERHKQRMLADLESEQYRDAPLKDKADYWHLINELELADWKFLMECPLFSNRGQSISSST